MRSSSLFLLLGPSLLPACSAVAPAGSGLLAVVTETAGPADPDGYLVTLDAGTPAPIPANGAVLFDGLGAGTHRVALGGLDHGCTLNGPATRTASVAAGDSTLVQFQVACPVGHPAGNIATRQAIPGGPYGIATAANDVHYAALIGGSELIRSDSGTNQFTARVVVGQTPPHVALDSAGRYAYATLQTGRGLVAVDARTNTLLTTVALPTDGFNLAVSPDGRRVFATTAGGTLHAFTAPTLTPLATINVGPAANGLAFAPGGGTLYVTSRDAGTVVAIDVATNQITRTIGLGGQPQRIAVAPDGSELYIANETQGLNVVTLATGAVATIPYGGTPYGVGVTRDGQQIYLLLASRGEVQILERVTRTPVKSLVVGGVPRNVAFSFDGRLALVTTQTEVVFIR